MKTVANCVESILMSQPFLEEALLRGIINYSALAEELQETVGKMLKKPVKSGAIMMALRRYNPPADLGSSPKLKRMMQNLGDITLRSNLIDFTFLNSKTLAQSHAQVLENINETIFYAFTRGIKESNIMVSHNEKQLVLECFKTETCLEMKENLSTISISLPEDNSKVTGLYYQIFKRLAWEGIALYEVVSTTNEFTVLVEDELIDKAFSVIKRLKN